MRSLASTHRYCFLSFFYSARSSSATAERCCFLTSKRCHKRLFTPGVFSQEHWLCWFLRSQEEKSGSARRRCPFPNWGVRRHKGGTKSKFKENNLRAYSRQGAGKHGESGKIEIRLKSLRLIHKGKSQTMRRRSLWVVVANRWRRCIPLRYNVLWPFDSVPVVWKAFIVLWLLVEIFTEFLFISNRP